MVSSVDEDEKVISRTKDCLGRENSATFLTENGSLEKSMMLSNSIDVFHNITSEVFD